MTDFRTRQVLQSLHLYGLVYKVGQPLKDRRLIARGIGLYSQFVKGGDICFDIGANRGNRTDIFLKLGAKVVVVEPQKKCFDYLERKYSGDDRVVLLQVALGEAEGIGKILVCETLDSVSSMSSEWIEVVRKSGRFKNFKWHKNEEVHVLTLDSLVSQYGSPSFCKIDVEGFEFNVVKGLTTPIRCLSFEFTPEMIGSTISTIEYLAKLDDYRFNYSVEESMELSMPEWVDPKRMSEVLVSLPRESVFGDVYAKRQASE